VLIVEKDFGSLYNENIVNENQNPYEKDAENNTILKSATF
jgi:hypothetical protein